MSSAAHLHVFVYGTLKRGFSNHARFCRGLIAAEEAQIVGRLYRLKPGYPMLELPDVAALPRGTGDADRDLHVQTAEYAAVRSETDSTWGLVHGEILTFDDPHTRLASFDYLEGFEPSGACEYWRVLTATVAPVQRTVWTYACPADGLPPGAVPIGPRWPA